jgi:hypothetical protein
VKTGIHFLYHHFVLLDLVILRAVAESDVFMAQGLGGFFNVSMKKALAFGITTPFLILP